MSLYCDARPATILFGTPNPFGANKARLTRENSHAKAANTLVGRSFPLPVDHGRRTVTVQVIKATTREVQVRPCFDLGEVTTGVNRGETIKLTHAAAMALLTAPAGGA